MAIGSIRNLGLAAKLNVILLAVLAVSLGGAAALLLRAGASSAVLEEQSKVDVLAKVIAGQAEFGITAKDQKFLEELLRSLEAEPQVVFAGAYAEGELLATHPAARKGSPLSKPGREGVGEREDGTVEALVPVRQADRVVGHVHVVSNLSRARARQSENAGTLAMVMGASTAVALVLA